MSSLRLASIAATLGLAACASSPPPAPASAPVAAAPAPPAAPPSAAPAPASGTSPAPAAAPPVQVRSPEAILADSVQATGGAAAWRSHKTARFKTDTTFQGMALGGTGERFMTNNDKSLTVGEFAGMGTVREGTNGKVFWAQDTVHGFRFLDGAEAEEARIDAAWNTELQAKELFTKLESSIEPGPDGTPLECVIATPRIAAPIHTCYDRTTHLQVLQTGIKTTPEGDVPFRGISRDWRDVGGVKVAFEAETQVGPITLLVKFKSVTFDEPMDDKLFEPPVPATDKSGSKTDKSGSKTEKTGKKK
jgi:hypothetical protein